MDENFEGRDGDDGAADTGRPDDRSPPRPIVGAWSVVEEDRSAADIVPWLLFAHDGELRGFDGCNAFRGRWTEIVRGAALEVERDERRACVRGTTALQSATTVVFADDTPGVLQAFDGDARLLLRLAWAPENDIRPGVAHRDESDGDAANSDVHD